jgi:Ras-related protein Rab-11A
VCADLSQLRQVESEEAQALAEREDLAFIETSALTGDGVETAFTRILEETYAIVREQELEKGEDEEELVVSRSDKVDLEAADKEAEPAKAGGCCK